MQAPHHTGGRVRSVASAVAIVLGCLLAPLALVGVWTGNEVADTDRYVANVAPLARDQAMQNAIADRATGEVVRLLDVPSVMNQVVTALEQRGLPENVGARLQGFAAPVTDGVTGFVHDKTLAAVRSDAFAQIWDKANRAAHVQLNAALSGNESDLLRQDGATVSIDLGPLVAMVKQNLVESGMPAAAAIPDAHPTFALFEADGLVKAQRAYDLLNTLTWALPVLSLGLLAAGVLLARRRRRALVRAALGTAVAMVVLGLGLWIGRGVFLDAVTANRLNVPASAALFDTLVRFLRTGLRTVLVLGLVVAAGAYLTGPSPRAVRARATGSRALGRVRGTGDRHGLQTGRLGAWVHANRTPLRIGAVVLAGLVFVFWDHPTGWVVLLIAAVLLVVLAAIELLARPPAAPASGPLPE